MMKINKSQTLARNINIPQHQQRLSMSGGE